MLNKGLLEIEKIKKRVVGSRNWKRREDCMEQMQRTRSEWGRRKTGHGRWYSVKRLAAFVLSFAMIFGNIGNSAITAMAGENFDCAVQFQMSAEAIWSAAKEAVRSGNPAGGYLTFGQENEAEAARYEKLFSKGNLFEITEAVNYTAVPDVDGMDLRVFIRTSEGSGLEGFRLTGDEELLFLYMNSGEENVSASVNIDGQVSGKTVVKSYKEAFGQEEVPEAPEMAEGSENAENTVNPGGNNTTTESKSPEELDETVEDNSLGGDEIVSDSLSGKDETMGTEQDGDDVSGEVSEMPGEEPEEESGVSGEEESGGAAKEELENPVEGEEGDADAGESDGLAGEEEGKEDKEESDTSVSEESGKEPGTPAGEKEENSAGGEEAKENTDSAAGEKEVQDNHSETSVEDTNKAETDTEKEESPETGSKNDGEDRKEAADTTEEKSSSSSQDTSDSAETSDRGSENTGAESELSKSDNAVDVVESSAVREYGLVTVDGNTTAMAFVMYLSDTGFVPESETEETPKAVLAFLDAVAKLPEKITKENAEEVSVLLYSEVAEAYDALLNTEYEGRADVQESLAVYAAVIAEVDAVMGLESNHYAAGTVKKSSIAHDFQQFPWSNDFSYDGYNYYCQDTKGSAIIDNEDGVYDIGTPNINPRGGWVVPNAGSYYSPTVSGADGIVDVDVSWEGSQLRIDFKPGTKSGKTTVKVAISFKYTTIGAYGGTTADGDLYFWYDVTNNVGNEPSESEKPDKPTDEAVKDFYSKNKIAVIVRCVDRNDTGHNGTLNRLALGSYTIGEVEVYDNSNDDLNGSEWLWMCKVHVDQQYYLDLWSRNFENTRGKHYLKYAEKDVYAPFYYFKGGYCSYAGGDLDEGWYCLTEDAPVYVYITHKKPVISYTVIYTDGVQDETVFDDQISTGLKEGADTPKFTMADKGTEEVKNQTGETVVQPKREGYTFMGWTPAVNSKVKSVDADGENKITYTATWKKIQDSDLIITKTADPSEVKVGQEVKFTIKIENPNEKFVTVTVVDTLPTELTFGKVSESDGGVYNKDNHNVTWNNVKIPASGSKELLVWVNATKAGTYTNKAEVDWNDKSGYADASIEVESETYKVTYTWEGLPEDSNEQLPTGSEHSAGDDVNVDTTYTSDKKITIDNKTYTFSGWSTEDTTIESNKFTMPDKNVNIHGIWNEDKSDKPDPDPNPDPDPTPGPVETKVDYTVEWYDADTNELIQESDTRSGVAGQTVSVTEKDKEVAGYTFVPEHKGNILTDSVAENGSTVLKLYFTKDKEPGKPDPDPNPDPDPTPGPVETKVDYTVEWYDADTNELIQESDTRSGVAGQTVSVTEKDKEVAGYTFVPGHKGNVLTALAAEDGSTVLKLYFTKDGGEVNPGPDPVPEPEPKDVAYTIIHEYYTNGTKDGESTQTLTGKKVGDTIHAADIGTRTSYNGNSYRYTSTDPTHLVLTEESDSNVLILRYDRTVGGNSGSSGGGGGGGGSTATNQTGRVHGTTPNPELAVTVPGDGIPLAEIPEGTDIPDEDVPLAGIPVVDIPDADVPLAGIPDFINILDDDVPLASVPKTSDSSGLWNMMALLSAFGLMAMTMMDRKKRQEKE